MGVGPLLLQPLMLFLGAVSYTMLYNCLDFPVGVVPVTKVTSEDEAQMDNFQGYFGDIWDKELKKVRPLLPFFWAHLCTSTPVALWC